MKNNKPKFFEEFKEFLMRGNVMDLAVAVVMGAAFTAIVNSLVDDLIMPLIGILTGGLDFSTLAITVGAAKFTYGNFIGAVINFVLIALVIFLMIKIINSLRRKEPEVPPHLCPYCKLEIAVDATRCPYCTSVIEPDDGGDNSDPMQVDARRTRRQIT